MFETVEGLLTLPLGQVMLGSRFLTPAFGDIRMLLIHVPALGIGLEGHDYSVNSLGFPTTCPSITFMLSSGTVSIFNASTV
jgi:hypothetical protein